MLIGNNKDYEELLFKAFTYGKDLKGIRSFNDLKKYEGAFDKPAPEDIPQMRRKGKSLCD